VFTTERERQAARVVMDVIGKYEVKRDLVPTSSALLTPEVQSAILAEVTERLKPAQGELLAKWTMLHRLLICRLSCPRPRKSWCSKPSTFRE
jgi:hypothetical protein